LLVYADDLNLLGDNINAININYREVESCQDVGLDVNRKLSICCCVITIMQGKILSEDS
jgi:hypothetical protein